MIRFRFHSATTALVTGGLLAMCCQGNAAVSSPPNSAVNGLSVAVPGGLDSRIRVFAYSPDVVYTLPVTVGMHTHIPLGPDEELIEKPKMGETIQWRVSGNQNNIYIKALKADVSTSLTLVTDKRVYQFELVATTRATERIQKAYFVYPDDEEGILLNQQAKTSKRADAAAAEEERKRDQELSPQPISPNNLVFFRVEGNKEYERMHAYDDGRMTFIRMPPGIQDLPALFLVDTDSKLVPINYTVLDRKGHDDRDVLKVERTNPKWLLKIKKSVEVKLTKE